MLWEWLKYNYLEYLIEKVIEGYLLKYSTLSSELFDKKICQLKKTQIDSLKTILPFKIKLNLQGYSIPPPPPPPLINDSIKK